MKTCSKCKVTKNITDFYKKSTSKDGLRSECKLCNREFSKKYKVNWYLTNKERLKNNKDIESISKYHKKYYDNNREKIKEYQKKYKENNSEKIKEYQKEYKENNSEKIKQWRKKYRDNKLNSDSIYKLSHNIRSLISISIKKLGYIKSKKTESILGCSFEYFRSYIESQFRDGMSWENQGEWHLDHKMPISWTESEEMVLELNHYTNFQTLWAKDNLLKGNKWSG
jgi:hypothetical protein